jgi:acyl-coenzyme A thioesterase PaaI-like protein
VTEEVPPEERERRAALLALAEATRLLCDAVARTAVPPDVLRAADADVRRAAEALDVARSDDRYSGLMDRVDYADPAYTLPLSPIVGAYSPVRPEVELWVEGARVRGRAHLERKHTGPPEHAHGGVVAMIADQLMTIVPWTMRLRAITKQISLRFRRPVPLYRDIDLEAWGEQTEHGVSARGTVSAGATLCVEIEADMVLFSGRFRE